MTQSISEMLFRDAAITPTQVQIETEMGKVLFHVYIALIEMISNDFGMSYEWRFYKDGKAWLFKAVYKKKTVFWLSAWSEYFQISFYFNEKTAAATQHLHITDETKLKLLCSKPIGKLFPLTMEIDRMEQLQELQEIMTYKINLK